MQLLFLNKPCFKLLFERLLLSSDCYSLCTSWFDMDMMIEFLTPSQTLYLLMQCGDIAIDYLILIDLLFSICFCGEEIDFLLLNYFIILRLLGFGVYIDIS